jgi:hypothetical protein
MPFCVVQFPLETHEGTRFFKGRFICEAAYSLAVNQMGRAIAEHERRTGEILEDDEPLGINAPRYARDESGSRARRVRGTHLTVSKRELGLVLQVTTGRR